MRRRTHFNESFKTGLKTACGVEFRLTKLWTQITTTADVRAVDCLDCQATPQFESATLVAECGWPAPASALVALAHDRLLLVEHREHRTVDQVSAWPIWDRADVAVWAGRCHLRASDNIIAVPPRPAIMQQDHETVVRESDSIFGPQVCFCEVPR